MPIRELVFGTADRLDCRAARSEQASEPVREESRLDLPTTHRIPLTWLTEHGGPAVRYRTLAELAPAGAVDAATLAEALRALVLSPEVSAVTTRQADDGLWGDNFLAFQPSERDDIEEVGTVAQYRRLVQLGVPEHDAAVPAGRPDAVPHPVARRRSASCWASSPTPPTSDPRCTETFRNLIREGACAALAEAGHDADPRLRGAAHKIVSAVSAFLRSPLAEDPFIKKGGGFQLHPDATPPTWWSLAMLSAMPSLQRERAGFLERLGQYLAQPAPDRSYMAAIGSHTMKPVYVLLGDPIELDPKAKGMPKDIPLALHYVELLAGIGVEHSSPPHPMRRRDSCACSRTSMPHGIWHPKNLRSQPKAEHAADLPLLAARAGRWRAGVAPGRYHLPPGVHRQASRLAARVLVTWRVPSTSRRSASRRPKA